MAEKLHRAGFQVEIMHRYGQYELPNAHAALIAHKSN